MLSLLRSDTTGEMEIRGDREQLRGFADKLRSCEAGRIVLSPAINPYPYSRSLAQIEFRRNSGKVLISLLDDRQSLRIQGGGEFLDVLADNIAGLASAAGEGHLHIDHYPDHYYLEEGAESLVISVTHDHDL